MESQEWNVMSPLRVTRVGFPCNEDCPSVTKCQSAGCNLPREGTACSFGMNKAHALSVWHRVPISSSSEGTWAGQYPRHQASVACPVCEQNGFKHGEDPSTME